MVRDCKVCGNSYNTCYSCEKERSWRLHTDTHEHYYIWTVLMDYQINHDAKRHITSFGNVVLIFRTQQAICLK